MAVSEQLLKGKNYSQSSGVDAQQMEISLLWRKNAALRRHFSIIETRYPRP